MKSAERENEKWAIIEVIMHGIDEVYGPNSGTYRMVATGLSRLGVTTLLGLELMLRTSVKKEEEE